MCPCIYYIFSSNILFSFRTKVRAGDKVRAGVRVRARGLAGIVGIRTSNKVIHRAHESLHKVRSTRLNVRVCVCVCLRVQMEGE